MSRVVTIVEKDGVFGLISLDRRKDTNFLTNYDSRTRSSFAESIANATEATERFHEAVAVSRDRAWSVVWTGEPNYG